MITVLLRYQQGGNLRSLELLEWLVAIGRSVSRNVPASGLTRINDREDGIFPNGRQLLISFALGRGKTFHVSTHHIIMAEETYGDQK